MNSIEPTEYLDLERDLPTTKEDVVALRRLRQDRELTFAEALELLSGVELFVTEHGDRIASQDWEPFQL